MKEIKYETGYAAGYIAKDKVCVDQNDKVCLDEFLFVEVLEVEDLDSLASDGVLGLSPDYTEYNTSTGKVRNNSFLWNLKNEGVIDEMTFSFYISDKSDPNEQLSSTFTIGGYDLEKFASG